MTSASASIPRLARPMAHLMTAALALVPLIIVLYVLLFPAQLVHHPFIAASNVELETLSAPAMAAAIAALLIVSAPTLWGVWELKRLFEGYSGGAIFTVAAARRLRNCGVAVLISAAKTAVGSLLLSLAVSIDLPLGRRVLALGLSSDDVALLLIGGVVLVIARVMEEGARLAEENAAFV